MSEPIPFDGEPTTPAANAGPPAPTTETGAGEFLRLRWKLELVITLQVVMLAGIVIVFLQFGGLAEQVANRVPYSGNNSGEIYQLQSDLSDLSTKVSLLTTRVIEFQNALTTSSTPSPSATR